MRGPEQPLGCEEVLMELFRCAGGSVVLPPHGGALVSRLDGGNLIVNPPRDVWERSELTAEELTLWSFLVAATGRAMIDVLPQLAGGCVNYWEAGNWALNDDAPPAGRKTAREHRKVHLHLLGRSPRATSPFLRWGEAPMFPPYAARQERMATFDRLNARESCDVIARADAILRERYRIAGPLIVPWRSCESCAYPHPVDAGTITCPANPD